MAIYFTGDTHFNHDKDFIWQPRGFQNVEKMNETIIKNWNDVITDNDEVYHLGDFFLGEQSEINKILHRLKGKIHLIIGNHDTDSRIEFYKNHPKIIEIAYATRLKIANKTLMLSHYPMLTANYDDKPKKAVYCLHGHIHSKEKHFDDLPYLYNVGCDAQNCKPRLAEDVIEEIKAKAYSLIEK